MHADVSIFYIISSAKNGMTFYGTLNISWYFWRHLDGYWIRQAVFDIVQADGANVRGSASTHSIIQNFGIGNKLQNFWTFTMYRVTTQHIVVYIRQLHLY